MRRWARGRRRGLVATPAPRLAALAPRLAALALGLAAFSLWLAPMVPGVASHAAAQDPARFWEGLGDPVLLGLVEEALAANPDLAAAEARVRAAGADRFEAALDLAPAVTAVGGYTRQRISGASFPGLGTSLPVQDVWEAGIRMSWEVDVFGHGRRSLAARSGLLAAAREDIVDARVLLSAAVATGYFRLRGAQDRLAVARRNAESQRRTLQITVERLEAGKGSGLDKARASAQLSSTYAALPALEAEIAAEQHRLSALLGREPGVVVEERGEPAPLPPLPESLNLPPTDAVVRNRADVIGAERRLAASADFAGAARADYLPRLSLQGAAGYTASTFGAIGESGTPRYAFGPVVSWPLLDLGRVKSRVDRARAGESEARARYEGAVLEARREVETSRVAYAHALDRLEHLEQAATASERARELASLRFEEGAGDFLEVLDAERRLLEAEDRLSEGRTAAANALVGVYRALGVSWMETPSP